MKKTTNRRALQRRPLVLERETIRHLSGEKLSRAAGGVATGFCTITCTNSCVNTCDGCGDTRTILCDSNTVACTGNNCTRSNL